MSNIYFYFLNLRNTSNNFFLSQKYQTLFFVLQQGKKTENVLDHKL
jgi:hypothetical protein